MLHPDRTRSLIVRNTPSLNRSTLHVFSSLILCVAKILLDLLKKSPTGHSSAWLVAECRDISDKLARCAKNRRLHCAHELRITTITLAFKNPFMCAIACPLTPVCKFNSVHHLSFSVLFISLLLVGCICTARSSID